MHAEFWHEKWATNRIGFHESKPNPLLIANFNALSIAAGSRIFVPLCGKTHDIGWLLSNKYQVAGVELSELAIQQLFAELDTVPTITDIGDLRHYKAPDIDIFVGDIFKLTSEMLGSINATFDRAALVALPKDMRIHYAKHLVNMTTNAPQLLITYEYNQQMMPGPPFSVNKEEVYQHYQEYYDISPLMSVDISGVPKDIDTVKENVWLLK